MSTYNDLFLSRSVKNVLSEEILQNLNDNNEILPNEEYMTPDSLETIDVDLRNILNTLSMKADRTSLNLSEQDLLKWRESLKIYPVGSIILTIDPYFEPTDYYGGEWAELPTEKALWLSGTMGQSLSGSLPKIEGSVQSIASATNASNGRGSARDGAFSDTELITTNGANADGTGSYRYNLKFNAARSSSIYNNSTGLVRPTSYTVYGFRRVS